jgi:hypothetical protein
MAKTDPTESFNITSGARSSPDGLYLGRAITDKISVYGVTPIVQRSGSAQVALGTTAATTTSPWGFATSTQADAVTTLVNELRASLVAFGMISGAA